MTDDDGETSVPGEPAFERVIAQGQFEFAKTRYIRTLATGSVERLIEAAAAQRATLTQEVKDLQSVVRCSYEVAVEAARAYGNVLPHRVGATWLQPPATLERVGNFHGSDRLYQTAAKAAKEFAEAQQRLAKKRGQLAALERELRTRLDRHEAAMQRQLETHGGLQAALQRDPLLDRAYKQMKALGARPRDVE